MAENSGQPVVVCAGILVADTFMPPLLEMPMPGQLVAVSQPLHQAGGCAVNTAVALNKLGVNTAVAGKVGTDAIGDGIRKELSDAGIDVESISSTDQFATSETVIISSSNEDRRYIHYFGANSSFSADDLARAARCSDILVIGGYLLLPSLEINSLIETLKLVREKGIRIFLDVAIPAHAQIEESLIRSLLPLIDCFLPNGDEAEVLTGLKDPVSQADKFLEWGCHSVFITGGAKGALYASQEQILEASPLKIDYVDGSGSGDAFTAGVVYGYLSNWDTEDIIKFASALGASACRALGCSASLFSLEEALVEMHKVSVVKTFITVKDGN